MNKFFAKIEKTENAPFVLAIKSGLIMVIPVLLIGSAALVFEYFPISEYQKFIEEAFSGKLFLFFDFIYNATFGMLSVYLTCAISFCYARHQNFDRAFIAAPITSLICFFIFSGVRLSAPAWDALGVKGVFIAIISSLISTKLLSVTALGARNRNRSYMEDSDVEFNYSVSIILPCAAVVSMFALFNVLVTGLFKVESIFALFVNAANSLFMPLGRSFLSGLLIVLSTSLLWFFGIHGSDVLESVMENLFTPAVDINISLVSRGLPPTEIFTKQFFDVFVLMGGCGTAICLLLAVLLFSKRKRNLRICRLAAIPLMFNINELMIFGYPVIYNTMLLVPFMLTPLFAFLSTYASMSLGLVPLVISEVNWTAPVVLSGYMATGSAYGSLLQLFNIAVGILIYRPFIIAYDRKCEAAAQQLFSELVQIKKDSETTLEPVTLTKMNDAHGALARSMARELNQALSKNELLLYYQPQYSDAGSCIGIEALLRWPHPLYSMIYPPLVIQLARETGLLPKLEEYVLRLAVSDSEGIRALTGYDKEISVNVSSATMQTAEYRSVLKELVDEQLVKNGEICLEITEQTAMLSNEETFECLQRIKDMGYLLAIDDFSMGHTSLVYLQASCFDTVKLDGGLVKDMMNNPRSYDIIKTITSLAKKLGFSVIAEYVETKKQVEMLKTADCFQYQGYLFSAALTPNELIARLKADSAEK